MKAELRALFLGQKELLDAPDDADAEGQSNGRGNQDVPDTVARAVGGDLVNKAAAERLQAVPPRPAALALALGNQVCPAFGRPASDGTCRHRIGYKSPPFPQLVDDCLLCEAILLHINGDISLFLC